MTTLVRSILVTIAAVSAVACSGSEPARVDEALRQDLSLASQAQPYVPQPYVSGVELSYDAYGRPVYQPSQYRMPNYPAPIPVATRQAPRVRRAPASASAGVYGGSAGPAEEVRNTQRDAILGAAAGGVLGAIYGQKVDVNKIPR